MYLLCSDWSIRCLEEKEKEENCHLLITTLLMRGAVIKTSSKQSYNTNGAVTLLEGNGVTLFMVGVNMDKISRIKFTTANNTYGGACGDSSDAHFQSHEMCVALDETHPGFASVHLSPGLVYHPVVLR